MLQRTPKIMRINKRANLGARLKLKTAEVRQNTCPGTTMNLTSVAWFASGQVGANHRYHVVIRVGRGYKTIYRCYVVCP